MEMVILEQEKELLPQITIPSGILIVNFPALTSNKGDRKSTRLNSSHNA